MGHITLKKIYATKTGMLRAKILVESENSTRSHILKITKKTSSLISGAGYSFFVYLIDLDQKQIGILVNSGRDKIKFNHIISVGGFISIETFIKESVI